MIYRTTKLVAHKINITAMRHWTYPEGKKTILDASSKRRYNKLV